MSDEGVNRAMELRAKLAQQLLQERDEARAEIIRLRGLIGEWADHISDMDGSEEGFALAEKMREAAKGEK